MYPGHPGRKGEGINFIDKQEVQLLDRQSGVVGAIKQNKTLLTASPQMSLRFFFGRLHVKKKSPERNPRTFLFDLKIQTTEPAALIIFFSSLTAAEPEKFMAVVFALHVHEMGIN